MAIITTIALVVLAALQAADIYTTWKILSFGGKEMNPVVAWFIHKLGILQGLLTVKGLVLAPLIYFVYVGLVPLWLVIVLVVIYVAVIVHNLKNMPK